MQNWYFSFRPTQSRNEWCQLMTRCSQLLGWVQMTLIWIFCQIKWRIYRLHSGGTSIACRWRNWKQLSQESACACLRMTSQYNLMFMSVSFTHWISGLSCPICTWCAHLTSVVSMVDVVITHPKCVSMSIHLYRYGHTVLISWTGLNCACTWHAHTQRGMGVSLDSRSHNHVSKVSSHICTFVQILAYMLMCCTGITCVCI